MLRRCLTTPGRTSPLKTWKTDITAIDQDSLWIRGARATALTHTPTLLYTETARLAWIPPTQSHRQKKEAMHLVYPGPYFTV
jgi:hypothetical protein